MSTAPAATTVGLLLAAGSGSRFDADAPGAKLLERIDGKAIVEHALDALIPAVMSTLVVTRDDFARVRELAAARGIAVVAAHDAVLGMGHSLAAGIRSVQAVFPGATTVVVALADMPWVLTSTIVTLVEESQREGRIAQPLHDGERGHPVVFPARFLDRLAASEGDRGARQLLREEGADVLLVNVNDAGVLRDIDLRSDLPS